jgi:hypothetical protein
MDNKERQKRTREYLERIRQEPYSWRHQDWTIDAILDALIFLLGDVSEDESIPKQVIDEEVKRHESSLHDEN